MTDRKISSFPTTTNLPSGAYLSYVYSGTNYKILDTDFYNSLGVTGTLTQLGAPTGTPVLDTQGTVNRIRNLESGNGIYITLSPYNGAKISHNFANGTGGVPLIKDINTAQPVVRNIQQGSGITVTLDDDTDSLIVAASGATVSTKTVTVSSEADFPTPVSGVITLADDTDYLIINDITTSNRFVANGTTTIRGATSLNVTLAYSGTGTMFTGTNCNLKFQNINIAATGTGSTLLNVTGGGTGQCQFVECRISECDTLGTITSMFLVRFDKVGFGNIKTDGLTCAGANNILFMDGCYVVLNGGTYIDLDAATFNTVILNKQILLSSAGGTTFLSGSAGSANINSGGFGTMIDCRTAGSATVLNGIAADDYRWEFLAVNSIPDSVYFGMLSMVGNATNTVISVSGTPVLVAGTWTVEETHRMTGTTGGRLTYDAERSQDLNVTTSVTVQPVSGTNISISAYIAVNGSTVASSKRTAAASAGSPTNITLPWYVDFTNGDYVEIFVANETNTTDVLVSSAVLRVG